jgi:hypothetical protein
MAPAAALEAHEAPRGWKCAVPALAADGGRLQLLGVSVGGAYRSEDVAECTLGRPHRAPSLDCHCGFYAFTERSHATRLLGGTAAFDATSVISALGRVDLHGTVIRHQHGYRAERQQLLSLQLLPYCSDCASAGRITPSVVLGGGPSPRRIRTSVETGTDSYLAPLKPPRRMTGWTPLHPLCDGCAAPRTVRADGSVLALPEVSAALRTDVGWLERDVVPAHRVLIGHQMAAL